MATYYVRPDGNNANAGTADTAAGAWATVKYALANAQNGVLANGDIVYIVADQGNYTENNVVVDRTVYVHSLRGTAVIDGTGGAAGSDCVAPSATCFLNNITVQNAVDDGTAGVGNAVYTRCQALTNGGDGFGGSAHYAALCAARANTGHGFNQPLQNFQCEAGDSGGWGFFAITISLAEPFIGNLAYDNASGGCIENGPTAGYFIGNTFEGNTGVGLNLNGAAHAQSGFFNNAFTNNSTYGITATANTNTGQYTTDHNNFHGNGTAARNNFDTGTNDTANAPGYVAAATDDYTLDTGSAMIGAGYSPFKSPMLLNQGATIAEVAATGGGGGTSFIGLRSGL